MQLPEELYADSSDMRTYRLRIELPVVAICEGSSMRLYNAGWRCPDWKKQLQKRAAVH